MRSAKTSRATRKREGRIFRVAHVGAFQKFSKEDQARNITALAAIIQRDESFIGKPERDIINLADGRDFLTETKEYDVVILHSIFFPHWQHEPGDDFGDNRLLQSPHSNVDTWRERLVATKAQYIVVCEGQPACLSGWQLGELDGYEVLQLDTRIALYRKKQ